MKTLSVGKLKADFSAVLRDVEQGESVTIEYGRRHTPVAVIVPFNQYMVSKRQRKLGILEDKGTYRIREDFDIGDEELLES